MTINKELLEILACPKCKAPVEMTIDGDGLACDKCKVVYPIREDIPVMLVEEAIAKDRWTDGERGK
ncbi:Trm112 family protein [Oleidesulfovibrio sp.]|uniref:Trm112 family protein n=1 Tax=Oleidesulfovibrio sp. TaxID=2909707 RepID=UPI003A8C7101